MKHVTFTQDRYRRDPRLEPEHLILAGDVIRMRTSIRLLGQPESMRPTVDAAAT